MRSKGKRAYTIYSRNLNDRIVMRKRGGKLRYGGSVSDGMAICDTMNYNGYRDSSDNMENALRQFNSISGYNEILIPAMCQLSELYGKYFCAIF